MNNKSINELNELMILNMIDDKQQTIQIGHLFMDVS